MAAHRKWTKERCIDDATHYLTRMEWFAKSPSAYGAARRHRWLDDCCQHMTVIKRPAWTKTACMAEAKKYKTRGEWYHKDQSSYTAARKNVWLDDCCKHMVLVDQSIWTKALCMAEAKKYKTRGEWCDKHHKSYTAARRKGWLDECCQHMIAVRHSPWTKQECMAVAQKYLTRIEWQTYDASSYVIAYHHGWLDECCQHMRWAGGSSLDELDLLGLIKSLYPKAQKLRIGTRHKGQYGNYFELDAYSPEVRKGIEFNGTYWHSPEGLKRGRPNWPDDMIKNYHQIKRQFFADRGIEYIEITEVEWKQDQKACISKCLQFLG